MKPVPTARDVRRAQELMADALRRGLTLRAVCVEAGLDAAWYQRALRGADGALLEAWLDARRDEAQRAAWPRKAGG